MLDHLALRCEDWALTYSVILGNGSLLCTSFPHLQSQTLNEPDNDWEDAHVPVAPLAVTGALQGLLLTPCLRPGIKSLPGPRGEPQPDAFAWALPSAQPTDCKGLLCPSLLPPFGKCLLSTSREQGGERIQAPNQTGPPPSAVGCGVLRPRVGPGATPVAPLSSWTADRAPWLQSPWLSTAAAGAMATGQLGKSPCWVEATAGFPGAQGGEEADRGPADRGRPREGGMPP